MVHTDYFCQKLERSQIGNFSPGKSTTLNNLPLPMDQTSFRTKGTVVVFGLTKLQKYRNTVGISVDARMSIGTRIGVCTYMYTGMYIYVCLFLCICTVEVCV